MGNLSEEIRFAAYAFLCPINRNETLKEHELSHLSYKEKEEVLFSHPEWLLDHYFKYSGEGEKLDKDEQKKLYFYLMNNSNGNQITLAFLCPVNRDSTRREFNYSDEDLLHHYNSLLLHYISQSDGAKKHAEEWKDRILQKQT
jgi:hypothetical protein